MNFVLKILCACLFNINVSFSKENQCSYGDTCANETGDSHGSVNLYSKGKCHTSE